MMNKNKRSGRPGLSITIIKVAAFVMPLVWISAGQVAAGPLDLPEPPRRVVVIDPGHGGHDKGVEDPAGITEKQVALALAEALKRQLDPEYQVIMTRTGDYGLGIRERCSLANHHRANLFISLHAGASSRRAINRWTIYHDSPAEPDETYPLRKAAPFDWNRLQQRHLKASIGLAAALKKGLMADLGLGDQEIDIAPAPLAILRGTDLPAVLIETGYLTHPATARAMAMDDELLRTARAIAGGIADYLENY